MKYTAAPAALYERNRKAFAAQMRPNTFAVFHAGDIYISNGDASHSFIQDRNLFWLTGIDQEEVMLILFPDAPREEWREVLFIRETNAHIQVWEGWKYSKEEARAASGIANVKWYQEFDSLVHWLMSHSDGIYVDINEHERNALYHITPGHRLAQKFRTEFPAHQLYRAAPILQNLRAIKSPEEVELMQTAVDITAKAFDRVLKFVKPGVMEYQIEAEIQHEFLWNRATGPAYGSIIASGKNACILHYTLNNQPCNDGDLLLMDFGAEYANYSSDLTRTIPVNGKFTARQKAVYNAVLSVMKGATNLLRPGTILEKYHEEVGDMMTEELRQLGLLTAEDVKNGTKQQPAYKKYFPHGTSHFLGLVTHDVGSRFAPMQPGMVFTCEPGIYIPEEGIGIRIENDILITADGNRDLMAHIPREVEEIEALMAK